MINKRVSQYSQLSNLQDIEREKKHIKQLIKIQGTKIEKDWNEIYDFWSFIPKITRSANRLVKKIPLDLGILTFVLDLLFRKKKK